MIFGLEGVLVDSRRQSESRWMAELGWGSIKKERLRMVIHGRPTVEALRLLRSDIPDADERRIAERINGVEFEDSCALHSSPGAREFIGSIPVERWAITSTSNPQLALARRVSAGIPTPLSLVATESSDDACGVYLAAATELKVDDDPGGCVVVEDNPEGVAQASRTGMRVLAIASTFPTSMLAAADWVVPSLDDLRARSIPDGLAVSFAG